MQRVSDLIKGNDMKREFKICFEFDDTAQKEPYHTGIRTYMDGYMIGCLQGLKFSVDTETFDPKIEIVFPDLSTIYNKENFHFRNDIAWSTYLFQSCPIFDVKFKNLDNNKALAELHEVGTNGNIDRINIKK